MWILRRTGFWAVYVEGLGDEKVGRNFAAIWDTERHSDEENQNYLTSALDL